MKRLIALAILCLIVVAGNSYGQTKRKPAKQPAIKTDPLAPPILPMVVNVGYHRNEPAIIITIKNFDAKRTIHSIGLMLVIIDRIKLVTIKQFSSSDFVFAIPVKPNENGISALTKRDDTTIDWEDRQTGRCQNYTSGNGEGLEAPFVFTPSACIGDV